MSASLINVIAELTVAASIAIVIVAAIRKPLRRIGGSRVAYLCWLLVPISQLVVSLPAPSRPFAVTSETIPQWMLSAFPVVMSSGHSVEGVDFAAIGVITWVCGSLLMVLLMMRRHRAFIGSLGVISAGPGGTHWSSAVPGPLLVGLLHPRVILPANFESLYGAEERELILAHEQAHRDHCDQLVNFIATIWLCLSWFNPLAYWAIARLRFDQELACDEVVLARRSASRRRYADALLKTQLAAESGWRAPLACSWQSGHPLIERVVMLKRSLPSLRRRRSAVLLTCAMIASGGYAVWMSVPGAASAQASPNSSAVVVLNDAIKALNAGNYEEAQKAVATIELERLATRERGLVEMILFNIALHDKRYDEAREHLEQAASRLPSEQAARVRYQGTQALMKTEGE